MSDLALVTGATGGLGLGLVEALIKDGYRVRAAGRSDKNRERLQALGAHVVLGDLSDLELINRLCVGVDCVFHVAALSSPWGPLREFQRQNVEVTHHLLNAAKKAGVTRFIFVSSPSVYARERHQTQLTEASDINPAPLNAYCATKGEAERLVLAQNSETFATIAVRPRAIIGPDDQVLIPRFLRVIKTGIVPLINDGKALIELTDVRDVAQALILADKGHKRLGGEVFNISGGVSMTLKEMIDMLSHGLGVRVKYRRLPYVVVRNITMLGEVMAKLLPHKPEPMLTVYSLTTLSFSQTFDLTKARDHLGYVAQHNAYDSALNLAKALWKSETS